MEDRREKLEHLRADGVEPFPHEFPRVVPIARIHEAHDDLGLGEETDVAYRVAGRIHARRGHGKAAFIDLDDRSGRIQLHARADVLGEESHARLLSLDLGDLIGVDGTAFKTRRGELSLRVRRVAAAREVAAAAAGEVPRPRGRRDPLPPPRARPDRERGDARAVHPALDGDLRPSGAGWTRAASSRSRRRSSSRSTAARSRARSRRTTTRSTRTSTCGSRPSSTSSG